MCIDPATAIALATAVGGTAIQMDAQQSAAKRQAREQEAATLEQQGFRNKNADLLMGAAQQYNGTDREVAATAQQAAAGDKLNTAVQSNQLAQLGPGAAANGTVSREFTALQGQRLMEGLKKAADTARLMGNLRGFDNLKQGEAATTANSAIEQGVNSAAARSQWEAAQPRIANAGRVNSGQMLLGSVLSAASGAIGNAGAGLFNGTVGPGISAGAGAQGLRLGSAGFRAASPVGMRLFPTG
jgi:hypothetical protein